MPFDPATDPWGTAMLAAAALWVLALLVVVTAMATRTSRRLGGRLMIVASLGFLGAAIAGTRDRIIAADAIAKRPTPPEPKKIVAPEPIRDPNAGPAAAVGDTAEAPTADAAEVDEPEVPEAVEPAPPEAVEPEPPTAPPASTVTVDPLPSDSAERDREIRASLRFGGQVSEDRKRCSDLDEVALAWARVKRTPAEPRWTSRARRVTEGLEECRKRLFYSASRRVRRAQVDARDAFAEGFSKRVQDEFDLRVAVSISGNDHERLRAGGTGLTAEVAKDMMAGPLRAELRALAFARVVLSDTQTAETFEFETTPVHRLGLPEMQAVGLGEKLELPAR